MQNKIELIDKRSMYAKHFDNGDGTCTMVTHLEPVHYRDESGVWRDCCLNIHEKRAWEFEYAIEENNYKAYFNDVTDIDNYTLAGFAITNSQGVERWINYKLLGAAPTGNTIDGNKIKYIEVFPDVDLEYIATSARLKENIILKAPVDKFSYTFTLKLDGARLEKREDGGIDFIDVDTQEKLWEITSPYMYDSTEIPRHSTNVRYDVTVAEYNGEEFQAVTVTVEDLEYLQTAVYPVYVDPTTSYTYAAAEYGVMARSVYNRADPVPGPPGTGSGKYKPTTTYSYCGRDYTTDDESVVNYVNAYMSYLGFDTSALTASAMVQSASLYIPLISRSYSPFDFNLVGGYINVGYDGLAPSDNYHFNFSFNDAFTLAITNLPLNGYTRQGPATLALSNVSNINRTGVTGFRCYADKPFYVDLYNATNSLTYVYHRHNSNNATLSITYTLNTAPNAPIITSYSDGQNISTNRPTITWAFSDPDVGDYQTGYQLAWSNDVGNSWTYSGYIAGNSTSYQFPTALADGNWAFAVQTWDKNGVSSNWSYRWNIRIDTTLPQVVTGLDVTPRYVNGVNPTVRFHFRATDGGSGIEGVYIWATNMAIAGQGDWNLAQKVKATRYSGDQYDGNYYVDLVLNKGDGQYFVRAHAQDNAGNGIGGGYGWSTYADEYVYVDNVAPRIDSFTLSGARYSPSQAIHWIRSGDVFNMNIQHYDGVSSLNQISGLISSMPRASWTDYVWGYYNIPGGSFAIGEDRNGKFDYVSGTHSGTANGATAITLKFKGVAETVLQGTWAWAQDRSGNTLDWTDYGWKIGVDDSAPTITINGVTNGAIYTDSATPTFSAADSLSGLKSCTATLNGAAYTSGTAITASGNHTLIVTATDNCDNISTQTISFTINKTPGTPTGLQCEGATNPTYVLDTTPEFSAVFNDTETNSTTTKIEIQVGTTAGGSNMWNSGVVTIGSTAKGSRCPDVSYAGTALQSRTKYYWRCRFTDNNGAVGPWSTDSEFTMGWLHKVAGVTPSKVCGVQINKMNGLT